MQGYWVAVMDWLSLHNLCHIVHRLHRHALQQPASARVTTSGTQEGYRSTPKASHAILSSFPPQRNPTVFLLSDWHSVYALALYWLDSETGSDEN
jgi:hypothetical protein